MRTVLAALAVTLFSTSATMAVEYRTPVTKQLFTCASPGLTRVATAGVTPRCCDGELKCAQFLSTSGMRKPALDPRT